MAIDRETIVSLHKKGESTSIIAKELRTVLFLPWPN